MACDDPRRVGIKTGFCRSGERGELRVRTSYGADGEIQDHNDWEGPGYEFTPAVFKSERGRRIVPVFVPRSGLTPPRHIAIQNSKNGLPGVISRA